MRGATGEESRWCALPPSAPSQSSALLGAGKSGTLAPEETLGEGKRVVEMSPGWSTQGIKPTNNYNVPSRQSTY